MKAIIIIYNSSVLKYRVFQHFLESQFFSNLTKFIQKNNNIYDIKNVSLVGDLTAPRLGMDHDGRRVDKFIRRRMPPNHCLESQYTRGTCWSSWQRTRPIGHHLQAATSPIVLRHPHPSPPRPAQGQGWEWTPLVGISGLAKIHGSVGGGKGVGEHPTPSSFPFSHFFPMCQTLSLEL